MPEYRAPSASARYWCPYNEGTPNSPERRVAIARKIVECAEALGIPRQDVIIDKEGDAFGEKRSWVKGME